jgi:hypothetical protein
LSLGLGGQKPDDTYYEDSLNLDPGYYRRQLRPEQFAATTSKQ